MFLLSTDSADSTDCFSKSESVIFEGKICPEAKVVGGIDFCEGFRNFSAFDWGPLVASHDVVEAKELISKHVEGW